MKEFVPDGTISIQVESVSLLYGLLLAFGQLQKVLADVGEHIGYVGLSP